MGSPTSKRPLAVVEWNDAWIDGNDPVTLSEVHVEHKPKVIITLGYILRDDDSGISLANEYYEDESVYRGRTFIPRGMIKSVTHFKLTKPRKPKDEKNPSSPS